MTSPYRLCALLGLAGLLRFAPACGAAGVTAVATIPSDIAFAACVISTYATDEKAGDDAAQIAADELGKCGGAATSIATILDAHEAAEVVEGLVPATGLGKVSFALRARR